MPGGIQAVLLDVGGVLLLPEHDAVCRAFDSVGAPCDRARLDRAHYRALALVEATRRPAPPRPAPPGRDPGPARPPGPSARYRLAYAEAAGVPTRLLEPAAEALAGLYRVPEPFWTRVRDGAVDDLATLAATGLRLALVSNTEHGHAERALRERGVCQVGPGPGVPVEAILDSALVGVAKPDPAIFRMCLARLGGIPPERAVHVGDSIRMDVEGARAAGLGAIHLDPYGLCPSRDHDHEATLAGVAVRLRPAGPGPGSA